MAHVTKDKDGNKLWCGRTWVLHKTCVWMSCFNPHDCGRTNSQGKWEPHPHCATNWNSGCPDSGRFVGCCNSPDFSPNSKARWARRCRSCGRRVPVEVAEELMRKAEAI